ncbi:MAG: peptide chain release factor N(5)-glutamine methyltransferase [Caldicoprobacterales bacterium]|nr:peptide chain release factor N(5)-glutamine methyltransferase [Clostridiales bacterium]
MNIIKAMKKAQTQLDEAGIESGQLEAGMLMAHLMGCERTYLYLDRERVLSPQQIQDYFNMVKMRVQRTPIHYIIGYREFMGLKFYVNENVLIPRPDTEVLVEYVINYCKNVGDHFFKILDMGTGSGAIAVSLAKYIENCKVTAIDIDDQALLVAKKNGTAHGVGDRIEFIQGDLFYPLKDKEDNLKFHIMVSNPPYIPTADIEELEVQVKDYEPLKALDGGREGLDYYRRLAKEAPKFLYDDGLWAVEVGYNQAHQVGDILRDQGCYHNIEFIKDLSGYNRVVVARMKGVEKC